MRSRWGRRHHYHDHGYQRPYRGGSTCLRDACLLETGCCVGEALSDNCLMLGLLLLPRMMFTVAREPRSAAAEDGPLVGAIRTYQRKISAHRETPCCRFTPSCSHYAAEAITRHGPLRGLWLAARRLVRCRPGGIRGADPVPS